VPSGSRNSRTSSNTLLPDRLTKIDETNRDQYYFLGPDDRCYFFGDFFSGKGWKGGDTNQLIKNFKRTPEEIRTSAKATQLQFYKDKAITEIASALRKAFGPAGVAQRTFIPIPPSKTPNHPDYCDRLEKTLRRAFATYDTDIRLLLRQTASTEPAKTRIRELFPDDPLLGLFVARSIHPRPFDDLDAM
jgi:hypothetical protein